jgi:hypothetical protein
MAHAISRTAERDLNPAKRGANHPLSLQDAFPSGS